MKKYVFSDQYCDFLPRLFDMGKGRLIFSSIVYFLVAGTLWVLKPAGAAASELKGG